MAGGVRRNVSSDTYYAQKITGERILKLMEELGCRENKLRCALTGRTLTPETVSLDHIVPQSAGGGNGEDNLQFVCQEANQAKGTLSQKAFIQLCRDVVKTHGAAEVT
jgi:5-methylcytosine-specific restriction endonuclease McrA